MIYRSKTIVLIPSDGIEQMYKKTGHKEGTTYAPDCSEYVTPREKSLGYFIRKELDVLFLW